MIRIAAARDEGGVGAVASLSDPSAEPTELGPLVHAHFRYVWRLLRRIGLPEADADDTAQQVFLAAASRLADIEPGRERAFLYGMAINFAARFRRASQRTQNEVELADDLLLDGSAGVDELVDQHRARELLDRILGRLPDDLRTVLVLHEVEELSSAEVASILGVPPGTVASRLRRARDEFSGEVRRLEARAEFSAARAGKERR